MKLKATIISIVSVLIVGLTAILLYCFWPAIKGTVDNSKYYTQEELQDSYDKGYKDGCKTETELTGQVKYYKDLVDEYYIQVNTLNDEITMLTNTNRDYATHVSTLESQKTSLQEQVVNLTTIKSNNETTISQLNTQIAELEKEVADLENSGEDKDQTIAQKNTQITNLQSTVSQLQKTNELNVETITNLNNQIASLNAQILSLNTKIGELNDEIITNDNNIIYLNTTISQLRESISYYESYIASLENEEKIVITFEFNGSVYNVQIVNKGSTAIVETPISTDYVIFNYWTVNNEEIDLSTYTFTTNTKVIANVTTKYCVKFVSDDEIIDTQIVGNSSEIIVPSIPNKIGYQFLGWTVNGIDVVTVNSYSLYGTTTFIAKYGKMYDVSFVTPTETQKVSVLEGNTVDKIDIPTLNSDDYIFYGWKLNGTFVDIETFKIYSDTIFVADFAYKCNVTFIVDNITYDTQVVGSGRCVTMPANPTKDGYQFIGWSLDGYNVIDLSNYAIISDLELFAVFYDSIVGSYVNGSAHIDVFDSGLVLVYYSNSGDTPSMSGNWYYSEGQIKFSMYGCSYDNGVIIYSNSTYVKSNTVPPAETRVSGIIEGTGTVFGQVMPCTYILFLDGHLEYDLGLGLCSYCYYIDGNNVIYGIGSLDLSDLEQ